MASRDLKGLTIEIGGDTSNLTIALKNVDKELSSLQSNLRTVNSALKLDPGNVDALAQKQALLTDAVAETARRLETLKEAQRQADQQIADGVDVDQQAYRSLQSEIVRAEASLNDYRRQLDDTGTELANLADDTRDASNEMDDMADSTEEAGNSADNAAEGWTIVKDVIADLASQAIQAAIEAFGDLMFEAESALDFLQAKTGASADTMEKYGDVAREVFKNGWGESLSDVTDAIGTVTNMLGELDDASLRNIIENAMTLRDVFGWDVQESVRAAKSMMDQFGISSDEAFNLMVQGAQNGLDQNNDLIDTINEYSVQFATAGYSANDMFNMLKNGADEGTWSVDKLGDAVKEMNIRISDGTADEAFEALGLGVAEADVNVRNLYEAELKLESAQKKYNEAVEEHGKNSLEAKEASLDLYDAQAAYNIEAGKTTTNLSNIKAAFAAGGDEAQGAMEQVMTAILSVEDETERYNLGVQIFGTMWEDLGENAVAALMDTEGAIDSTNDAMEQVKTDAYDNLATSVTTLGRTLKTEIFQPIVDAITPAIKGIVGWAIEHMDILKPIVIGVATAFGVLASALAISGIISSVQKAMALLNTTLLANPITLVVAAIAGLVAAFVALWNNCEGFRNFWIGLWETIKSAAQAAWTAITGFFSSAWDTIMGIWNGAGAFFSGIWDGIKNVFSSVKDWFTRVFSSAWDGVKSAWNGVTGFFSDTWNSIKNIFGNVGNWFRNTFSNAWNAVKGVFSNWGSFFGGLWDTIKNKFSSIGTNIANAIGGAVKSGINGVISAIERTINSGIKLINGAIGLINLIPGVNIGKIGEVNFPRLAKGGVIYEPTLAEIGEYSGAKRNPEIVTPQDILRETFEESLAKFALDNSKTSGTSAQRDARRVDAKLDTLLDIVSKYLPHLANKTGIYLDKRRLVGELAPDMDKALGDIASRREVDAV